MARGASPSVPVSDGGKPVIMFSTAIVQQVPESDQRMVEGVRHRLPELGGRDAPNAARGAEQMWKCGCGLVRTAWTLYAWRYS